MSNFYVLLVLISVPAVYPFAENSKRAKRIVNGFDMWDNQVYHYKAFEYFVWIGKTWVCAEVVAFWNLWGYAPPDLGTRRYFSGGDSGYHPGCQIANPTKAVCGGTLLTPRIVHTACHCFVLPIIYTPAWLISKEALDDGLQHNTQIFMGSTSTRDMNYPISARKIQIHPKCGKVSYYPHYGQYDFAWILLESKVPEGTGVTLGSWGVKLDYAGPYVQHEVKADYEKVVGEMHVCLIIGFGQTRHNDGTATVDDLLHQEKMRHGYVQITDWFSCYHFLVTGFRQANQEGVYQQVRENFVNFYNQSLSWACAKPLPKLDQNVGSGDSGSPIACNGQYFALVSATLYPGVAWIRNIPVLDIYAAIKFDLFAVAVEYRSRFIVYLRDLGSRHEGDLTSIIDDIMRPDFQVNRLNKLPRTPVIRKISSRYVHNEAIHSSPFVTQLRFTSIAIILSINN